MERIPHDQALIDELGAAEEARHAVIQRFIADYPSGMPSNPHFIDPLWLEWSAADKRVKAARTAIDLHYKRR